jgi:hypothetical protein
MSALKYIPLFILIQLVSAVLFVIGVPLCAALAYSKRWTYDIHRDTYHWKGGRWTWLWDNQEDGTLPYWYALMYKWYSVPHAMFMWTALRNPVNNLRFVRGVSGVGRPLWRKTFVFRGKHLYVQAGWNNSGYPVLSGGANVHSD